MEGIVPGIVLAAGRSRRMGRTKALLPAGPGEETFISRIVRVLRDGGVDEVLVVVDSVDSAVAQAVTRLDQPARVVVNPTPARGQLSSLQAGLRTVDHPGIGGLLVTLVDVPLVSSTTVRALLAAHRTTGAPVVRPMRAGRHGHPVIFDRSVFDELRRADDTQGAKAVVQAHLHQSVEVPIEDEGPFYDVDTPADYERVFGRPVPEAPDGVSAPERGTGDAE